ncbi:carbohydrate ABC transporter permease [Blautia liquoris]|uniref:Carbohydrate ABC transporter permease n=1 Tax=Blautia liquoris TaxID=2779518 RepID=A0A7M2RG94_9FIRM|nr:carbohydrate ABC transporter permease [Blautia liquoris]QOV18587.1 carbohydrate ABC transporter permease [Blautia liquoris]
MIENKSLGSKIFDVCNVIVLILISLVCIVPLWYILMVSVSSKEAVNAGLITFWPVGFNLLSYQKILGETAFLKSFWISLQRVVLGGALGVGCTLLVAYPLSRSNSQFPKRNIFMWILIFCMLFNGGTIPWYMTMRSYHLTDNVWGLVLSGGLPVFNVIMAMNFFRNLPSELEEVAYVDGADPWTSFIKINIPLAKPMIATITLLTIVGHWNDFFQGLVLSTKQSNYPLQTYIQQMVVTQNYSTMTVEQIKEMVQLNNQSLDAAKIFIAMVPILMIYPFLQKYFVKGITLGSVKG